MNNLEIAKQTLNSNNYTLVAVYENKIKTSLDRGVKPLINLIDSNQDFSNFAFADKVIGKAAAFLYVILNVKAIYTPLISEKALIVLKQNNIYVEYDKIVPLIRNRTNTGYCPMETLVLNIDSSLEAYQAIKKKVSEMKNERVS